MGKRRDRRHAAPGGGGGRKVKLDLRNDNEDTDLSALAAAAAAAVEGKSNLSEISGTVEEGGEKSGVDSEERLSQHSLAGPVQVNPLSLLGQYSDDDGEGEEKMLANGLAGGVSPIVVARQEDQQVASFYADLEINGIDSHDNGIKSEEAKQANPLQDVDNKETKGVCDWEAILHKESSDYYYWNKVTGETTWEKPAIYAEFEIWKATQPRNRLEIDSKHSLQDPHSRSEPALEVLVQEDISKIDDSAVQDVKKNELLVQRCVADGVEGGQLKDCGCELMSIEHAEKQDAGSDHEGGKGAGNCLDTRQGSQSVDCSSENVVKSCADALGDPRVSASAVIIEHGSGNSCQVKESMGLNAVENNEGAEGVYAAVGFTYSEHVEDHPATVHRADATGLKSSDLKNVAEQSTRYDRRRLLERSELLAKEFKMLAGEALRRLSLRLRLAIESEIRLSDCKAMAMHGLAEDRFWEHMDSQFERLEALLPDERAALSLEVEKQIPPTRVEDRKFQSRTEGDTHGGQSIDQQPEATGNVESSLPQSNLVVGWVSERSSGASALLRSEDEDMDVDMDLDMAPEDEYIVETSVAARSADNAATSASLVSLPYESTVGQPVMYTPTPPLPQVISYGHMGALPPEATYLPTAQPLPPLSETPLFPAASTFPNGAPGFPAIQSSFPLPQAELWIPPPPPEDEWVPPPLPDQEPPPLPDENEPPHSAPGLNVVDVVFPSSNHPSYLSPAVSVSASSSILSTGTNQETAGTERHDAGGSKFGAIHLNDGTTHVNGNALPSSVSSSVPPDATTNKLGKSRVKKRSHSTAVGASLKSNKKVSTLVNKWLAAQEELHSSDESDEGKDLFDVEASERKRQKQIEEWRYQTLASGGALENANFQPLGALDWRERVKRAKKEASKLAAGQKKDAKAKESKKDPTNASDESSIDVAKMAANTTPPKRPDLKEVTKDLPAGWQAFWDAESHEVYYGNISTSETSWDRPT